MPKYSEDKKQLMDTLIKDKVFTEACELLQQGKPELFSMRELADRVGVSKGTLYNYFADKYEVIFFLEQRIMDTGEKNISALLNSGKDYHSVLCILLKHLYLSYKKYRFMFAAAGIARSEEEKKGRVVQPSDSPKDIVTEFLRKGVASGALVAEAPEILDQYLLVILGGLNLYPYAYLKNAASAQLLTDEIVDRIITHAVDGICRKDT